MKSYYCESCGAELLLNSDQYFTQCLYCGNNIAITTKDINDLNIKKIIPFDIDRDEAINSFSKMSKKKVVKANKVYVPVRYCDFNYNYLFYFQYCVESTDEDGHTTYSYYDKETLLDGRCDDEFIGNGRINNLLMSSELRRSKRIDYDPQLLSDVSVEISEIDVDQKQEELKRNVERYCYNQFSKSYDISAVYSENFFLSNLELEPFTTLIPVYVIKTSDNGIYNVPGIHLEEYYKKHKEYQLKRIFEIMGIIVFTILGIYLMPISGKISLLLLSLSLICLLLLIITPKKNYKAKEYDNYVTQSHDFRATRKKLKI